MAIEGGISPGRIKNDPAFQHTRENRQEFTRLAKQVNGTNAELTINGKRVCFTIGCLGNKTVPAFPDFPELGNDEALPLQHFLDNFTRITT